MKAAILIFVLATVGAAIGARGAKTYGDSCNVIVSAVQIFSSETNYAESCDLDKKLVCAINKCACPPSYEWQQNIFGQWFGFGGECVPDGTTQKYGFNGAPMMGGVVVTIVTMLVGRYVVV